MDTNIFYNNDFVLNKGIYVQGIDRLTGEVCCEGSKNSALMCMAAAALVVSGEEVVLTNVPNISDVHILSEILKLYGKTVKYSEGVLSISGQLHQCDIPEELTGSIRGASYCLGFMISVLGEVQNLGLPGGDRIGSRPIDIHLENLELMGVEYELTGGKVNAVVKDELKEATMYLRYPSVGATCNIILAAVNARGRTIILNAAKEPEIVELANMLIKMGAKISGVGSDRIVIDGKNHLSGNITYEVSADRIETGTYIIVAAMLGEKVKINKCIPYHNYPLLHILKSIGVDVEYDDTSVTISRRKKLKPLNVIAMPFPGMATDLQPLLTILALSIEGESTITDMVFPERFQYVYELTRMGADIEHLGNSLKIKGNRRLVGNLVEGRDIRAVVALICAGLLAEGTTKIAGISHLNRGYSKFVENMVALGADIKVL